MGDAGWEDRFSDPGRPKAASRRGRSPQEAVLFFLSVLADSTTARTYPQASLVLKYEFSDVLRNFGPFGNAQKSSGFWRKFAAG